MTCSFTPHLDFLFIFWFLPKRGVAENVWETLIPMKTKQKNNSSLQLVMKASPGAHAPKIETQCYGLWGPSQSVVWSAFWLPHNQADAFMATLLWSACGSAPVRRNHRVNSAPLSARCLNGPNAAAGRRGRRRRWRSRSTRTPRASRGRPSQLTVVTARRCWPARAS